MKDIKLQLDETARKLLKDIQKDIETQGYTSMCPSWGDFASDEILEKYFPAIKMDTSCRICKAIFPKVSSCNCPCQVHSKKYILRKIQEILRGEVMV